MCGSLTLCYMYINSLVVRQASAPEGVSPAQRWILTDPEEFEKKLDTSTKGASEILKPTDLEASHDDPESNKEDDKGQVILFKTEQVNQIFI